MRYDMGEPCELPAEKTCEKLEPTGQWFRWRGTDGGWRVGKAIMPVDGWYLMHDVAGHWLVDADAIEPHPRRDDWERNTLRLSPVAIQLVCQHMGRCMNDPIGRVSDGSCSSFFDAPENFAEGYLFDFGDGVRSVALAEYLDLLIEQAGLTTFVKTRGLMGLKYDVERFVIVGVSAGDDQ